MDPQQKQLLQCVYRALENAGIPMEKASGTRTGVFVGMMNRDYETNAAHVHPSVINHWTGTGLAMSIAANRVSYIFNFTGPSLSIDSACSSSLVALHLACLSIKQGLYIFCINSLTLFKHFKDKLVRSQFSTLVFSAFTTWQLIVLRGDRNGLLTILSGDSDMAVCGGVNCIIEPRVFVALSKAKMIAPDGKSKPFSTRADGYGRGEGCGVVLLKPLKKALQDNDNIWGIISKTGVNQDGHSVTPITKPSMTQQEELLCRMYTESDIVNVQYIEAHGTGTPVGDTTEATSISNAITKHRPPGSQLLTIGSVKSNIGHTESAAGVAGLIKVLLMMKHETIVPSVFYSDETSSVDTKSLNIRIPKRMEKWKSSRTRVAGVNNFGFGGTNAHVIVKQHKKLSVQKRINERQLGYFVLSANSMKSLSMTIVDTIKQLATNGQVDLDSLLYTSSCRRSHYKHKYRIAMAVSSVFDLEEKLKAAVDKNISAAYSNPRLVFVFCGNGLTYHGMCKQLLKSEPVFRRKIAEITQIYLNLCPLNILDTLESEFESSDYRSPDVAQPLLFAVQVGIATLLQQWGVKPDAILGHSVGEVAAAHCSGLLSVEDALKVIYYRSSLQKKVTGGKMLVVSNMAVSEVTSLLPHYSGRICIAAFNSPQSCTLSGDADAIKNIKEMLSTSENSDNLFLHVLNVSAAYHSHLMDPILPDIRELIGSLQENNCQTELYSTVTGKAMQPGDFCTGEYWARNVREPVAFVEAVESAAKGKKNIVFVEIGPKRALQRNIIELFGNETKVIASVHPQKDHESVISVVSKLFELGVQVDWSTFYRGSETVPLLFPKYQFDCSDRDVIIGAAQNNKSGNHPVLCQTGSDRNIFTCDLMSDSSFYLKEHKHNGVPIIPGAFYAELGVAAFLATAKPKVPLSSLQLSVTFHSPFVLTQNSPEMKVHLEQTQEETRFTVLSASAVYASGTVVSKQERLIEEQSILISSIFKRCTSVVNYKEFYGYLSQGGFEYGQVFQNKEDVHYGEDLKEAFAEVCIPEDLRPHLHDYYIHPVVLDYLMQLLPVTVEHVFAGRPGFPAKIGSLIVCGPLENEMIVYLRAIYVGSDHFEICGCFANKEGRVLVEVKHVIIQYLGNRADVVQDYFYHNDFSVIPGYERSPPPKALVFGDDIGISKGLQQHLDSNSRFISVTHAKDIISKGFPSLLANLKITDVEKHFDEVLFFWGKENLTSSPPDVVLQILANCCEVFRQIVLELKQIRFPKSIRAVTYCSSDITVDHINPGFAVAGMTRSFAAEIPDLSFQLIDISAISTKNFEALSEVLRSFPCSKYPELVVKDGQILKPSIARTPNETNGGSQGRCTSNMQNTCIFLTSDAHKISQVSAVYSDEDAGLISDTSVEIKLTKLCVHSTDYFPVSVSHLKFGQSLYWNKHSSQKHKLLALDFSGTIAAVGKDVRKWKVGDRVASCYPVQAATKVRVPEDVCYSTKRFLFLQKTPCVSYFVLAWAILHRALPRAKDNLGIISNSPNCALVNVLACTSTKLGWNVIMSPPCNGSLLNVPKIDAFVIMPPFNESMTAEVCNFPGVKHVIIICDSQADGVSIHEVFQNLKSSVNVEIIKMSDILQKGYLRAHRSRIHHWLKSLNVSTKVAAENYTFQPMQSENDRQEISHSYFKANKLAVVSLERAADVVLSDIPVLPTQKQLFRKGAVYIVAGGLSGLGFETVKFISQKGGEYIVILSRSKPTLNVQQDIHNVEKQCGNSIVSIECDISVPQQMHKTITLIDQKFPNCPIRGVFHSAVVLHDGLIETLNKSMYEKVFRPKVNGVLNLHNATLKCQLDYFVCYSSISAFLGNASQTNYAAANSFLDLFCQYRRKLGLPGQSINWGALNLGLLLNKEHFQKFLEAKGMMVLDVTEIHKSLEQCLRINRPQQAVCRFHFRNIRYNILSQNQALTMRLSALVEEAFQKSKEVVSQDKETDKISAKDYVFSLLSETAGLDQTELKDNSPLSSLGVDSMQAMTLQNLIFQEKSVNVPLVKLLDPNATLSTVIDILSGKDDVENFTEKQESSLAEDRVDETTRL
uniref:Highly reducing polyketide synthase easB-like n=1 Tax=Gouania willdenowi TaxID=441366 RepID=A0A8C5HZN9_GOUWI